MPESNFTTNDQATLRQLVRDAESQVESLTSALDTLRSTVRRLAAQVEMSEGAAPSAGLGYGFGRAPQAEAASPADEKPFDFSAAAAALSQEIETASHAQEPVAEAPQTAMSYEQSVAETPPPPSSPEPEWYGVSDGGSWPVGPKSAEAPKKDEWAIEVPAAPIETLPATDAAAEEFEPVAIVEDTMTDVAEAVAAQEEPVAAATDSASDAPVSDQGALTDAAAEAAAEEAKAEQKRQSLSSGWPDEGIWSQSFDWPAMRSGIGAPPKEAPAPEPKDEFRSMVDQVRAEIEAARASGEQIDFDALEEPGENGGEARLVEVQRMVEELRSGVTDPSSDASDGEESDDAFEPAAAFEAAGAGGEPAGDDEEARREEARLAVEQMRAEMAGGHGRVSFDPPPAKVPAPSLDWSHMSADLSGPPVIVVKDTEGRVELANVYDLLNRLECGESAALLNYTPHSVTVGLPIRSPMPSLEAVEQAVGAVFGRSGAVDTDGVRITVQMGTDGKKKRSEDAA